MASRLTVIVSQTSVRDGRSVDLEETLVAELMMTPGLDATLIGPIETIQVDSTDFLCLSTFNHNFGFVSWLDEATVASHWNRLGLTGTVARPGSLSTDQAAHLPKPRVYHFQIQATGPSRGGPSEKGPSETILNQIQQLQRERAVKTVGIGLGTPPAKRPSGNAPPAKPKSNASLPISALPHVAAANVQINAPAPAVSPTKQPNEQPNNQSTKQPVAADDDDDEQWQQLDQLVDDLDAFDF